MTVQPEPREDMWKYGIVVDPGYIAGLDDKQITGQLETDDWILAGSDEDYIHSNQPSLNERVELQRKVLQEELDWRSRMRATLSDFAQGLDVNRLMRAAQFLDGLMRERLKAMRKKDK